MPEITHIKNYPLSKDYIALTFLARRQAVILICRDGWIGKTLYQTKAGRFAAVSENCGTVYINLCEEENFINALQVQDVRFLMPEVSEHDKEAIETLRQVKKILEE